MSGLHRFFVLTKTSLYVVADEKDDQDFPLVEKIAIREKSGIPIGARLRNGHCVGIAGLQGIVLYNPKPGENRGPEVIVPILWGSKTSSIVGLFLEEADARQALFAPDLEENDLRFQQESAGVLDAIGSDHAVFVISNLHYKNSPSEA